jgi:hypothetical protein
MDTQQDMHRGYMTIDNESPPDSWREEILKGPASVSQLREVIADLKHSLKVSKAESERLKDQNSKLMNQLTETIAREMETLATNARLKKEISEVWKAIKTV